NWPAGIAWRNWPGFYLLFDGRTAVTMFFVLSGLVLALPYVGDSGRKLRIGEFYLRRFIRIYLPWLGIFIASWFVQRWQDRSLPLSIPLNDWFLENWAERPSFSSIWHQLLLLFHSTATQLVPQDWSLRVELRGSALIPLFLFLLRRNTVW